MLPHMVGSRGKEKQKTKTTEVPDKTISKKSDRDAVKCVVKTTLGLRRRQLQPAQVYNRQLIKASTCTVIPQTLKNHTAHLYHQRSPLPQGQLTAVMLCFTLLVKADYVLEKPLELQ